VVRELAMLRVLPEPRNGVRADVSARYRRLLRGSDDGETDVVGERGEAVSVLCGAAHPQWPAVTCVMFPMHVAQGTDHIGGGYSWPVTEHPANLVAGNPATAVVPKLSVRRAEEIIGEWERFDYAPSIIADYLRDWIAIRAELLRLCGPPCEHCGGKRAIEHDLDEIVVFCTFQWQEWVEGGAHDTLCHGAANEAEHAEPFDEEPSILSHQFQPSTPTHPPAPEIEVWLREHA
jgi:hypothetical protein